MIDYNNGIKFDETVQPGRTEPDRGWLYEDDQSNPTGFYLRYDAIVGYRDTLVLAVVYKWDEKNHPHGHRDATFPSVVRARNWMIEQKTGQLSL